MGKIVKFLLTAILCLFLLGMVMELIAQFGGVLIVIVAVGVVLAVIGKNSSEKSSPVEQVPPKPAPEPVKKAEDDKIEKLHVDMED